MTASASGARDRRSRTGAHGRRAVTPMEHPRSVPIVEPGDDYALEADQPFAEGSSDAIDPDLRHRMISEAAYHRYVERGYEDGYDFDDWQTAEAEIDHLLLKPGG
jgi:hypothetical protein